MPESAPGLPLELTALGLGAAACLGALIWLVATRLNGPRARIERRLALFGDQASASPRRGAAGWRRRSVQQRLRQVEGVRERRRAHLLYEELMRAGLRIEVWHYLAGCAGLFALVLAGGRLAGVGLVWAAMIAAILGIGLPRLALAVMARRRMERFTGQFADAIDIVVRGARSGLPLGECLNIIGREMPDPLGAEFRLITEGQKLGMSLSDVLARASQRTPTQELRYFATVIAIQQQTGGNLADTLAKLSDVLRARKRMRDKVSAYASEARASAMIIGSLPLVVVAALATLAPDYVGLLFSTDVGHVMLVGGGLAELVGLLVMRKMIRFDI